MVGTFEVDILDAVDISRRSTFGRRNDDPAKIGIGPINQCQPIVIGIFEVDILDAVDISRQSTFGRRNDNPARIGTGNLSFNVNRKW